MMRPLWSRVRLRIHKGEYELSECFYASSPQMSLLRNNPPPLLFLFSTYVPIVMKILDFPPEFGTASVVRRNQNLCLSEILFSASNEHPRERVPQVKAHFRMTSVCCNSRPIQNADEMFNSHLRRTLLVRADMKRFAQSKSNLPSAIDTYHQVYPLTCHRRPPLSECVI